MYVQRVAIKAVPRSQIACLCVCLQVIYLPLLRPFNYVPQITVGVSSKIEFLGLDRISDPAHTIGPHPTLKVRPIFGFVSQRGLLENLESFSSELEHQNVSDGLFTKAN